MRRRIHTSEGTVKMTAPESAVPSASAYTHTHTHTHTHTQAHTHMVYINR
jgi:hypothetical protein